MCNIIECILSIYNNSGIKNAVHLSTALLTDASKGSPKICDKHENKTIPQEVAYTHIPGFREFKNMVID